MPEKESAAPAEKRHGGAPKGERTFRVKRTVRAAPHTRGSLAPKRRDKDNKMRLSALRPPLGSVGSKTKA
jgi:hypothetical protein